jgi:hypothetical protein
MLGTGAPSAPHSKPTLGQQRRNVRENTKESVGTDAGVDSLPCPCDGDLVAEALPPASVHHLPLPGGWHLERDIQHPGDQRCRWTAVGPARDASGRHQASI